MERLPNESEPAYAAFVTFLQAGVGRSARETGRKVGKSWSLVSRWCAKYHWLERAKASRPLAGAVARKSRGGEVIASAGLWAKRMEKTREEAFQVAEELIAKARAMLKFPLSETTSSDGKTVVKPGRWSFADAARMMDTGNRLRQLATGLPTERLEHAGLPQETAEAQLVSVEELQASVFDQMRRELLFEMRRQKAIELPEAPSDAVPGP